MITAFLKKLIEEHGPLLREGEPILSKVRSIGDRINRSSAISPPCRFEILESDRVNAFALPGKVVALTLGAVRLAGDESAIAGLLGHEIAHLLEPKRNSRDEFRADRRGIELAVKAGFEREGLLRFLEGFERLLLENPGSLRSFGHPPTRERIEKIKN